MRTLIFGNGSIHDYDIVKKYLCKDSIIICCDGGMRHALVLDIIPDFIIGDLDSAKGEDIDYFKRKNVEFFEFPSEKDKTDMEIAVQFAINKGNSEIYLFGALGSRIDHSLANMHILKLCCDNGIKAFIVDEKNVITMTNSKIEINGNKGDIISLIPFTPSVENVTTNGLYYKLENAVLYAESSRGISNVMLENKASVDLSKGILFVIKSQD